MATTLYRCSSLHLSWFPRLLLPLLLAALPAAAQYQVGGKPIALPAPPGYVDSANFGPELLKSYSAQAVEDVRFLAVFLCDEDAARLRNGEPLVFERYLAVRTARQLEAVGVDDAIFELIKQQTREEMERPHDDPEVQGIESKENVSAPRGMLYESDQYFIASAVNVGQVEGSAGPVSFQEAATSANLRIKGMLVSLCAFDVYRTDEDLLRTQETVVEWFRQVLRVNALPVPDLVPAATPAEAAGVSEDAAFATPAEAQPIDAPVPLELPPLPQEDKSPTRFTVFMTLVAFTVLLVTALILAAFLRFVLFRRPLPWAAALAYGLLVFSVLTLLAVVTGDTVPYLLVRLVAGVACYVVLRAGARLYRPLYPDRRPSRVVTPPIPEIMPPLEEAPPANISQRS